MVLDGGTDNQDGKINVLSISRPKLELGFRLDGSSQWVSLWPWDACVSSGIIISPWLMCTSMRWCPRNWQWVRCHGVSLHILFLAWLAFLVSSFKKMKRKPRFSIFFNSSPLDISCVSRSLTYLKGNVFANVKIHIKQNGCPATV